MARGPFSLANEVGFLYGLYLALVHLGIENEGNEFTNEEIHEKMEDLGILTSSSNPVSQISTLISVNRERMGIVSSHGYHRLNKAEMSKAHALLSIPVKVRNKKVYTAHQKKHAQKLVAKLTKIIKG